MKEEYYELSERPNPSQLPPGLALFLRIICHIIDSHAGIKKNIYIHKYSVPSLVLESRMNTSILGAGK